MSATSLFALAIALGGCVSADPGVVAMPQPSYDEFVRQVEPVLEARCADPSCHGRPERPLAVYSPLRWRADPALLFEDAPLTEAELRANYVRACSFIAPGDAPASCLLVRKPLAPDDGGCDHRGGVLFADTADDGYRTLLDWIAGAQP